MSVQQIELIGKILMIVGEHHEFITRDQFSAIVQGANVIIAAFESEHGNASAGGAASPAIIDGLTSPGGGTLTQRLSVVLPLNHKEMK
jgi:hypothetical protein